MATFRLDTKRSAAGYWEAGWVAAGMVSVLRIISSGISNIIDWFRFVPFKRLSLFHPCSSGLSQRGFEELAWKDGWSGSLRLAVCRRLIRFAREPEGINPLHQPTARLQARNEGVPFVTCLLVLTAAPQAVLRQFIPGQNHPAKMFFLILLVGLCPTGITRKWEMGRIRSVFDVGFPNHLLERLIPPAIAVNGRRWQRQLDGQMIGFSEQIELKQIPDRIVHHL
jgi:hypothetical protein